MKHQFKPFDKVLVRNTEEQTWKPNFYSFEGYNSNGHVCTNDMKYAQCIPYNKETAHLVNTTNPYKPEEPKEWEVRSSNGLFVEKYTSSELQNFINIAVINNKNITNFSITRIF